MKRSRLKIIYPQLIAFFEQHPQKVFSAGEIEHLMAVQQSVWRLPQSVSVNRFIEFLLNETDLREERLGFLYRPIVRYVWGAPSLYEMAMSLKPDCYLLHFSALEYHRLIGDTVSPVLYVNSEQDAKPRGSGRLTQPSIDAAFRRPARMSRNQAPVGEHTLCLLNGKWTGNLGVFQETLPSGVSLRVTGIERTLNDSVVRPAYAGGPHTTLEAFRQAAGSFSPKSLAATLRQLDHVYPYHQAVGFYLDRSGCYDSAEAKLFEKPKPQHDYYLAHEMDAVCHCEKWRVFYPPDLPTYSGPPAKA